MQLRPDAAPITHQQPLRDAIGRLARAAVLVVGDAILDQWVHGTVDRVTPDAPVPVLDVTRNLSVPGGAGNVVRNLGALGAAVAFVSVVGDDQAGSDLTGLMGGQAGLEPWLLVQGARATSHKARFVAHGQQMLRVDREDARPVHPKLAERLVRIAHEAMAATSVTVLSDYGKGVLAGGTPAELIAAASALGRSVVVGTRGPDFARFAGADVLATGWPDLVRTGAAPAETDEAVARAAIDLGRAHRFGAVVVVRTGMSVSLVQGLEENGSPAAWHFRNRAQDVRDISGTGDTVLAVLGAALAAGLGLPTAAEIANLAASIVVERVGTAVARRRELLAALDRPVATKVVDAELAIDRVERWRRTGLRTGFAFVTAAAPEAATLGALEAARAACDRLILAIAPSPAQTAHAETLAALPYIDLVVPTDGEAPSVLLQALRPDLLVTLPPGTGAAGFGTASADLVRGWGGRVMQAAAG